VPVAGNSIYIMTCIYVTVSEKIGTEDVKFEIYFFVFPER